jgi:hypothetical protein
MNKPTNHHWPVADLDPVRRLRALAAGIPGAVVVEDVIPASFGAVWGIASDLENEVPRSEWHVRSLRITRQEGDPLEALVYGLLGVHDRFAIVLRPGWCWMQGRLLLAGMAATPVEDGILFAFATGLRVPGSGALRPVLRRGAERSLRRLAQRVGATTGEGIR